jgi:diguanylate cyclase (GGDEF)-like protein/PAS domain S-box-containing protein
MEAPRFGNGPVWESDPHFRIVTHPNRILLLTCDPRGYADFVNPQWSALTGIHSVSLLGFGWHATIDPDDLPPLLQTFQSASRERAAFRERVRIRHQDGTRIWMVAEGQPRINELGSHVGFLLTCLDVTPHTDQELELDLASERLTDLIRESQLPGLALDAEGNVIFFNEAFCRLVGRPAAEIEYRKFAEAIGLDATAAVPRRLYPDGRQRPDFPHSFETGIVRADRGRRTVRWQAIVLRDFGGHAKGAMLLGDDITQEVESEQKLLLTHRVFETTDQAMVITDAQGTILSVNRAFSVLTGYPANEAVGQNPRILQSGRHDADFYAAMWNSIRITGNWHGDIWDQRKDGSLYPKFLSISAIRDERGEVTNYSGIFYDISERKAIEERLEKLAHVDSLTGLANRTRFFDQCEAAFSLSRRTGKKVGLIYLDLDHFKTINDSLGHESGDQLLRVVADRLRECIRRHDTVARLGGDEFVLLLPEINGAEDLGSVAEKVQTALAKPLTLAEHPLTISASLGASIFPDHAGSIDNLVRLADRAMYDAKEAGRARLAFAAAHTDPQQ